MEFKPKFIYFDLDDTLLDHKEAEQEALRDIYRHFKLFSSVTVDKLIDVYHQINRNQWAKYARSEVTREELQRNRFELTLHKLGLDISQFKNIGSQYMKYYQNHWQ